MEPMNAETEMIRTNTIPQKSTFHFSEPGQQGIFFTSEFESGNMSRVVRENYRHYSLWTACDAEGTSTPGFPKSWFYFEVGGFNGRNVTFSVHRVHFLWAMLKKPHLYRPVYRIKDSQGSFSSWARLPHPVQALQLNQDEQLVLRFDYSFTRGISVQFAFLYPYQYDECCKRVQFLKEAYKNDKQFFLEGYQLIRSYEGRKIQMLMISSHDGKAGAQQLKQEEKQYLAGQKVMRFKDNKPIVFISSRVHPIETPSSFCMEGIIQFLLDKKDIRAHLLRKHFVFILIPMLNPDGVSRGHCRMDALNQNLNRYYRQPDPVKQPSCYAVKKLCEHYNSDKRIFMYLDLHAHPAHKGNFIFGNAIYSFAQQVESLLFPKVLSNNCINFEFEQCNFSRKHMKAKDRNEDISKEGCGRVLFYKQFGLTHSYTLECGYHCNTFNNQLNPPINTETVYVVPYRLNDQEQKLYDSPQVMPDQQTAELRQKAIKRPSQLLQYTNDPLDQSTHPAYLGEPPFYTEKIFTNLGRNILISLLDVWQKNPHSRISDLNAFRKQLAQKQSKLDRFRKEQSGIRTKQKKVVELIETQCYAEWKRRNVCGEPLGRGRGLWTAGNSVSATPAAGTITAVQTQKNIGTGSVVGAYHLKHSNNSISGSLTSNGAIGSVTGNQSISNVMVNQQGVTVFPSPTQTKQHHKSLNPIQNAASRQTANRRHLGVYRQQRLSSQDEASQSVAPKGNILTITATSGERQIHQKPPCVTDKRRSERGGVRGSYKPKNTNSQFKFHNSQRHLVSNTEQRQPINQNYILGESYPSGQDAPPPSDDMINSTTVIINPTLFPMAEQSGLPPLPSTANCISSAMVSQSGSIGIPVYRLDCSAERPKILLRSMMVKGSKGN